MLMVLVLTLAALLDSAVSMDVLGASEPDVMDCGMFMVCKEKNSELWGFLGILGMKAREKAVKVFRRELSWDEFENTDEKWLELPGHFCPIGDAGYRRVAVNVGDALANFWGASCEEENSHYDLEECEKMDEAATFYSALLKKKIDNEECGMAAKAKGVLKGFGK